MAWPRGVALLALPALASATNYAECQADVVEMVNALAHIGADITFSTADCEPEGFSILDCTNDIIPVVTAAAEFAAVVSKSTDSCGEIDNFCAASISSAFKYMSDAATNIVAAVSDCNASAVIPSPITCAVDIFSLIDDMVYFAVRVDQAVHICNAAEGEHENYEAIRQFWRDSHSTMGRRLQQAVASMDRMKRTLVDQFRVGNRTGESLSQDSLDLVRSTAGRMKEDSEIFI
mmetsp:Transcript_71588/g.221387  ORF Transcript_71588/g.221387 Transcript_71588/m.221387 type:complete len:233 (-) Transcript_71588:158-856(-)